MKKILLHKNERVLGRTRALLITNLRVVYADNDRLAIPLERLRAAHVEKQRKPWILFVAILLTSMSVITGQWSLYPLVVSGAVLSLTTLGCYCCMKEEVLNLRFSDRSLSVPTQELTANAHRLADAIEQARSQIQLSMAKGGELKPQHIKISA